jgi:hypothetical protein
MTVKEQLTTIASNNTSIEQDDIFMANLCHRIGFPQAKIVCGIAYLEGKGTIEFPPMPIQQLANMLLKVNDDNKR